MADGRRLVRSVADLPTMEERNYQQHPYRHHRQQILLQHHLMEYLILMNGLHQIKERR